ncbi:hypothetical protein N7474_003283 [Penicillium riverlandense]|uniref:uncharacterized protein n=1 Tax=Penicillium riverlandense TaxID=1903569 RepID=UPI002547103D|nr:uncharacterized protein N7474_003283 [Penicillium riverlandense]KAJ5826145.1 hypothetical protein N7474_003283 [Penicillium riverlandense]
MPRTIGNSRDTLEIELAAPRGWSFAAGNTIIGNVVRHSKVLAPQATVTIVLKGRVKTKVVVRRSHHKESFRGRWQLLDEKPCTVYKGPLHLAEGENSVSWPFSVAIPTGPEASFLQSHSEKESFLPLDDENVSRHCLPGSFHGYGSGRVPNTEGFVEYFLEAELRYSRSGTWEAARTTYPITLRHASTSAILDPDIQQNTMPLKVQSQRRLSRMEDEDLTLKQKTQKFLRLCTGPQFHYKVEVLSPRALQLDDPTPIPFSLRIVPEQTNTSENVHDRPQIFHLNWVKMTIKSTTMFMAPGNFSSKHVHYNSRRVTIHLCLEKAFDDLESPITLISDPESEFLNIGDLLQPVLCSSGLWARERCLASVLNLHPDFVTYNIRHSNWVKWDVSLDVAGDTHKFSVSNDLKILPAV